MAARQLLKLKDVATSASSKLVPQIRSFKFSDMEVKLASPDQLQPKPEVDKLEFGKNFTDHMLRINYDKSLDGWQTPRITPMECLSLHPAAKVLHYAIELFEGMKAYRGRDGKVRLFRPDMNMARMNKSAIRAGLPTFDSEEMIKCLCRFLQIEQEWVPHSEAASLYIRPTLIGTEPTLGVTAANQALMYAICCPVGSYYKGGYKAVSALADPKYTRAWPGGAGDRKMGSNYGPTVKIQAEAQERGFEQVLWLYGEDDQITEAGTMNIFILIKNEEGDPELITPPLNGIILPGITRDSILELAREISGLKITERVVTMKEFMRLLTKRRILEMFGAGTAAIVSPIASILYKDHFLELPTMQQENKRFEYFLNRLYRIQYGHEEHPWSITIDDCCSNN